MAKRKRLTPPIAPYQDPGPDVDAPRRTAPIADVAADAASAAALSELSHTLQSARDEGRLILPLPLDAVQSDYLLRDRQSVDAGEMDTLKASLAARGQQTPIEVAPLGDGRYGLISGWRRLQALKALHDDGTGPGTVLAIPRAPAEASEAYVSMVEENEIRVGISFYERARIVCMAARNGVYADEKQALKGLFGAVSRSKRSKIGSFMRLHDALGDALRFPEAISERLGLALVQRIEADKKAPRAIRAALKAAGAATADQELAVLTRMLAPEKPAKPAQNPDVEPDPELRVCAGIQLVDHPDGSLTLRGRAVRPALRDRLIDWLRDEA